MRVLVTGGAGYIGSVVNEALALGQHEVVVVDNLSKGHRAAVDPGAQFVEADLESTDTIETVLREERIDAVVHMAASSLVGESNLDPLKYYRNNVRAGISLVEAMARAGVRRLVFSSTAAVYGEPLQQPIDETAVLAPTNAYGETKLAFERALAWFDRAYGIRFASLRYFNAAGASERHGESHDPETHLIPIALDVASGRRDSMTVYGDDYDTPDGTCVRDYIHVEDLARAHVLALEALEERSRIYNLGCGGGFSVREVLDVVREVTGRDVKALVGERRSGDPAVLVASSELARSELGWRPERENLREIVSSAWSWLQRHPDGYATARG
jgi:UDP-glucose 4-epimerase